MTEGELAVLVNRDAGRGRSGRLLPEVLARLTAGGRPVRVLDAPDAAGAQKAAREAVHTGAAALVAVGGDGTVHLALQAVAGTDTPLGIVPAGTGNDFAAEVGLPTDPLAAADRVATGTPHPVDLAHVTGQDGATRWFGAVLGAGFDAIVNERANRLRFPRGRLRYDLATALELAGLRPRRYQLVLDGVVHEVDAVLVAVGNTASYGGGIRICPGADPTDGLLDVLVAARIGRLDLIRLRPKVPTGAHVDHPRVTVHRARTVSIAADAITAYADGERTFPLPVVVTCVPGALALLR